LANYKGSENGTKATHDYNWWDGVKEPAIPGTGVCGVNSQVPCGNFLFFLSFFLFFFSFQSINQK